MSLVTLTLTLGYGLAYTQDRIFVFLSRWRMHSSNTFFFWNSVFTESDVGKRHVFAYRPYDRSIIHCGAGPGCTCIDYWGRYQPLVVFTSTVVRDPKQHIFLPFKVYEIYPSLVKSRIKIK